MFDEEKGPSEGWLSAFISRHPNLSLRKAAYLNGGRYTMGRLSVVNGYFSLMADIFKKLHISDKDAHRIYNLDETGFNKEPKYVHHTCGQLLVNMAINVGRIRARFF